MRKFLLTLLFIQVVLAGIGQIGQLDPRFGNKGFVRTTFGPTVFMPIYDVYQVLSETDGSFYLVYEVNLQAVVTRYHANAMLDTTYGNKGYSEPVPMLFPRAVLQQDGKIVLGGMSYYLIENEDFKLARLNTNGLVDSSFGKDGKARTRFFRVNELTNLALQSDGRIVAVGTTYTEPGTLLALSRYNPDGSPDSSFSQDGKLTTEFGGLSNHGYAVAIQADGKIVVAGNSVNLLAMARYFPDGSPDSTFNGTGKKLITLGTSVLAKAMVIQPNGKILVAVYNQHFTLVSLHANGTPDNDFSGDGIQVTDFGISWSVPESIALQNDGKIVVAGNGVGNMLVARYNTDGELDNSFSGDGYVMQRINMDSRLGSLVVQPNGKILAGGTTTLAYVPSGFEQFYLAIRFNSDGSPDNNFDGDGILTGHQPVIERTRYEAVAVQSDGKVIAGGYLESGLAIVARYRDNGVLDSSFSNDGIQTIAVPQRGNLRAVAIQPDGKIYASGTNYLLRLNSTGSIDSSFSGDGIILTEAGISLQCLALQPDGKIIVAGGTVQGVGGADFFIARYNADGSPDIGFSEDGQRIFDITGQAEAASSILLMPDEKIIVVGDHGSGATYVAVVRLNKDGTTDPAFGNNGSVSNYFIGDYGAASAALANDGKIVMVGDVRSGLEAYITVVRINSNGSGDNSFSGDGEARFRPGTVQAYANIVLVQPDGKIIVGGFAGGTGGPDATLLRVNTDGSPDNSFSEDGFAQSSFGHYNEIRALAFDGARLYAAGYTHFGNQQGFVAAYLLDKLAEPPLVSIRDTTAMPRYTDTNTVYRGYLPASSITLTAQVSDGTPPYTYLWSNGDTTPATKVSPTASTTYVVTITDAAGATASASKEVIVVDVRCGNRMDKVLVFEDRKGHGRDCHTLCVAPKAVSLFLRNGWNLGQCTAPTVPDQLRLTVYPNPSYHAFTINISANKPEKVEITVRDICGRIMEKRIVAPNSNLQIGGSYRPGLYLVEARQGFNKETVKIIKLPHW